jgi:hypothetical protein
MGNETFERMAVGGVDHHVGVGFHRSSPVSWWPRIRSPNGATSRGATSVNRGGYFMTGAAQEVLLALGKPADDGAEPPR